MSSDSPMNYVDKDEDGNINLYDLFDGLEHEPYYHEALKDCLDVTEIQHMLQPIKSKQVASVFVTLLDQIYNLKVQIAYLKAEMESYVEHLKK